MDTYVESSRGFGLGVALFQRLNNESDEEEESSLGRGCSQALFMANLRGGSLLPRLLRSAQCIVDSTSYLEG
jgi:hypothetical protein